MQRYQDSIILSTGQAVVGASVQVLTYPAGAVATIYSDNSGTVATNPLITDANGHFAFYAADSRYSLSITKVGIAPITISDILLEDPADGSAALSASGGAALVGFLPSGTGAVARTVQSKGREIVSVTDYGAINSAGTDNATFYANAVAALPSAGGELRVPAGTYDLASVVALAAKQVRLVGEGLERSIIQVTGSAAAFSAVNAPYLEIQGVTIKRKAGNANTIATLLSLSGPNQLRLIRSVISGADTTEINLTDGYNIEVENCIGTANAVGAGTWLKCNGTAPTTVRTKGNEITSYNLGIDYGSSFGTLSVQDIFVNCNTGRKYNGGNTHVILGTWAENAVAGKYVSELAGTGSVNVIELATRVAGANPPALWNFTGGAVRSQVLSLNGQSSAFLNYTHNIARCQVKNSGTQAVNHNTNTVLTWDTENFDTDAMHAAGGTAARITIVTPGTYRFSVHVGWDGNVNGYREVFLRKNGATTLRLNTAATIGNTDISYNGLSTLHACAAADYFDIVAYQNSGSTLNVQSGESSVFEAEWVGT